MNVQIFDLQQPGGRRGSLCRIYAGGRISNDFCGHGWAEPGRSVRLSTVSPKETKSLKGLVWVRVSLLLAITPHDVTRTCVPAILPILQIEVRSRTRLYQAWNKLRLLAESLAFTGGSEIVGMHSVLRPIGQPVGM